MIKKIQILCHIQIAFPSFQDVSMLTEATSEAAFICCLMLIIDVNRVRGSSRVRAVLVRSFFCFFFPCGLLMPGRQSPYGLKL